MTAMSLTVSITFSDEEEGRDFASAVASRGRVIYQPVTQDPIPWEELWPSLESVTQLAVTQDSFISVPGVTPGTTSVTTGHLTVGTSSIITPLI